MTNYRSLDYSTIKNAVFNLTKDIRNVTVDELKIKLLNNYADLEYNVDEAIWSFGLNGYTKKYIQHMLARITGFIEEECEVESNYCNYINTNTKNPYEEVQKVFF